MELRNLPLTTSEIENLYTALRNEWCLYREREGLPTLHNKYKVVMRHRLIIPSPTREAALTAAKEMPSPLRLETLAEHNIGVAFYRVLNLHGRHDPYEKVWYEMLEENKKRYNRPLHAIDPANKNKGFTPIYFQLREEWYAKRELEGLPTIPRQYEVQMELGLLLPTANREEALIMVEGVGNPLNPKTLAENNVVVTDYGQGDGSHDGIVDPFNKIWLAMIRKSKSF